MAEGNPPPEGFDAGSRLYLGLHLTTSLALLLHFYPAFTPLLPYFYRASRERVLLTDPGKRKTQRMSLAYFSFVTFDSKRALLSEFVITGGKLSLLVHF